MTDNIITIDGSQGEGGGQIVRSSMALSVITGHPVRLHNIRARRSKPGLRRQHLTAVKAAAEICGGHLTGAELNATQLQFFPGQVRPGEYRFRIGTAGSAMLVLQTVLPPLLTADGPSTLILEGGTHNQWAPPFDFLQKSYVPLVNRMGPQIRVTLQRHGFYPAGGGRVSVHITPSAGLQGIDVVDAGRRTARRLRAIVANLPTHIADREVRRVLKKLNWRSDEARIETVDSDGPGNVLMAEIIHEQHTEVLTAFGSRGVSAEKVADELVRSVRRYEKHQAPIGEHLADQILLPLGLSAARPPNCGVQRGGVFRTGPLSTHTTTHIDLLQTFLNVKIETTPATDGGVHCHVRPGT